MEKECELMVREEEWDGITEERKKTDRIKVHVAHLKHVKGIPDFWFMALYNNPLIRQILKEPDFPVLQHVRHIDSEKVVNGSKYLLVRFYFCDNDYFENDVL